MHDDTRKIGELDGKLDMVIGEVRGINRKMDLFMSGDAPPCKRAQRKMEIYADRISTNTGDIRKNTNAIRFGRWAAGLVIGGGGATGIGAGIKAWLAGGGPGH